MLQQESSSIAALTEEDSRSIRNQQSNLITLKMFDGDVVPEQQDEEDEKAPNEGATNSENRT